MRAKGSFTLLALSKVLRFQARRLSVVIVIHATHGAFGALAFGIGTSEVEHVMATNTLILKRSKNLRIDVSGELGAGVTAKDVALADNWQYRYGRRHGVCY